MKITRRRVLKTALLATGAGALLTTLVARFKLYPLGGYAGIIREIGDRGLATDQVVGIGREFLKTDGVKRDPSALFRDLTRGDYSETRNLQTLSALRGLRDEIRERISEDLRKGDLIQINGYFVTPSFAKFCAAVYLHLG